MKRTVAILEAMWRSSDQECARLEAENERLLALVMEVCNEIDELGFPGKADQFKRRALESKP
jgi:hypothetical protein